MLNPHVADSCPVARTLGLLGDHWSMLVVRELLDGPRAYERVRAELGVSDNTLSRRLADLQGADIVRRVDPEKGVRQLYALTPAGQDLAPVLAAIGDWGVRWRPIDGPNRRPPEAVASLLPPGAVPGS